MGVLCYTFLAITLLFSFTNAATDCEVCEKLAVAFMKGLENTEGKNFEGGDVDWEEKNLKYKTSETRLIEILEKVCEKSDFKCNKLLEEQEEAIETWYKKFRENEDKPLRTYLCITTVNACCPENKFGDKCAGECPKGNSDEICFGRGKCEGAGDREGSGKCVCDSEYTGDVCDKCADHHFEIHSNDTYILCKSCHQSCDTCSGENATECIACRDGFKEEEVDGVKRCVDINECVEQQNLCGDGEYCANTAGSYKCEDIDECSSGAVCLGMYEVCVNTPGHYKCECARFFRRDPVSNQCQPDPAIYSRYVPKRNENEEKKDGERFSSDEENFSRKSERNDAGHDENHHDRSDVASRDSADDEEDFELSWQDIQQLSVALIICLIGTMAASGNICWTLLFFLSILFSGMWWASDKTDRIATSLARSYMKHQEL
ncbi:cysteine-rich with EGF-like domain protein 2-A isoform X2 [Ciona intestinalis]